MPLDSPTCFKQLQHLEQEGAVQPDLSSFGKKKCIYGHTEPTDKRTNIPYHRDASTRLKTWQTKKHAQINEHNIM